MREGKAAKSVANRWVRIFGLALVLFVLPMAIVWPLASWMIESAENLGAVSPSAAFTMIVGLLGLDAVAMIPHGLIGALAGTALPWAMAAIATWLGIMLASTINYAIGRYAGRPLAERIVGKADMQAAEDRARSMSGLALFGTRPVPVIGEVILVAAGIAHYPFKRFLIVVGVANAFLAPFYAGLPAIMGTKNPEQLLLVATIALPAIATLAYGIVRISRRAG